MLILIMGSLHIIFQADGYCLCNTMPTQNAFFRL